MSSMPKLDEAVLVQTKPGNAARRGGIHDRAGARPQFVPSHNVRDLRDSLIQRVRPVGHQGFDVLYGDLEEPAHSWLGTVLDGHVEYPLRPGLDRFAAIDRNSRPIGQFQADVLDNVPEPGTLLQPLDEPAPIPFPAMMFVHARERSEQALQKPGNLVAFLSGKLHQVKPHDQDGIVTENIWPV